MTLKDEIALTIKEKIEGKCTPSEIHKFIKKKIAGIKKGVNEVDNVRIIVSFDMECKKRGRVIGTYNVNETMYM